MPLPSVTPLPTAPSRSDDSDTFVTRADAFLGALGNFATELNALGAAIVVANAAANYNSTSTTSQAITTGSVTLTVDSGKLYAVGQYVIASSASGPTNYMSGIVTAYNATTGALTFTASVAGGSGTKTDWNVSLSGVQGAAGPSGGAGTFLELAGGTMTGPLVTLASAAGGAGFNLPPGAAPTAPVNGDLWTTAAGIFARIAGATLDLLSKAGGVMTGALTLFNGSTIEDSGGTGYSLGYLGAPLNAQNGNYTLALADIGKRIYSKNTGAQAITIPTNAAVAFAVDDTMVPIVNRGTTALTIVPAGGVTLERAGTTDTGTRTLAAKGVAFLQKVETNIWMISGVGLT
jgi:hypothetical protein